MENVPYYFENMFITHHDGQQMREMTTTGLKVNLLLFWILSKSSHSGLEEEIFFRSGLVWTCLPCPSN